MQAQANSGAVVLADDLKSPAMEKLDLVRKWSINTYKVILCELRLDGLPSPVCLLSLLSSSVYQADAVGEVGSWLQDCGRGAGGSNRDPPWQQEKVPARDQAGSDAGQSAVSDDADTKAAGRCLLRPEP